MTRKETQDFLAMVQAAYPNYNPQDKTAAINVWLMALEEYDKNVVALAFKAYLTSSTSGFAPALGQIIDKIQMMTQSDEPNEMEAWGLVREAISNSAYGASEEFTKLPPLVQKAVGVPDQLRIWAMDEDYSEAVVSSNFIKCYKVVVQRQKEIDKMPENVKRLIEDTNKGCQAARIEQKRQQAIQITTERQQNEIKALESVTEGNGITGRLQEMYESLVRKLS